MGFGFSLIGFPLLLLSTVVLVVYAIARRTWKPVVVAAAIWALTILLIITATTISQFREPIRLTKTDIIGEYRIDTNFFKGADARWQYNRYRFTITPSDSIFFYVMDNDTVIKTFNEKIIYSSGPPDLWKVKGNVDFHILKYSPTLYRGHKKFYYVFTSDNYSNMFFRKVKN